MITPAIPIPVDDDESSARPAWANARPIIASDELLARARTLPPQAIPIGPNGPRPVVGEDIPPAPTLPAATSGPPSILSATPQPSRPILINKAPQAIPMGDTQRVAQAIPMEKPVPPPIPLPSDQTGRVPPAINLSTAVRGSHGEAIPTGRHAGIPGYADPGTGVFNLPNPLGVAQLFNRAEDIHNPVLRSMAKAAAIAARTADVIGTIAAPRITAAIPGTQMNEVLHERANRAGEAEQAKVGLEKAQAAETTERVPYMRSEETKNEAEARGVGKTPDEQTFHDLLAGENGNPRVNPSTGKPYTPFEAFSAVNQAKQDVKPPTAEEDRRLYGTLLDKLHSGTITSAEQTQLNQLQSIYPNLAPMGEAAAGQANARMVDYLSQNPDTRKKVAKGQVPDEYRVLPTDTREEAKDKEARAQALGSAAQRQIGINVNAGEHGIEAVAAQTPDGTLYESKAAAEAAGHKILNKANPAEVEKARQAYTQYGRMIDNAQEAMMTMPAWKNENDRKLGMQVSKQFFSHIPVVGVDPGYVDQFLNSDDYRAMSRQGQEHMQNMFQIWSDAINVVKQETGGVPRGQMFLQKEDAILPHPEKTYDMNVKALNSFVKRMKKDSSEYPRPAEMPDLQGGIAPPDAQGYINKNGRRIGYIDAQGKRVEF